MQQQTQTNEFIIYKYFNNIINFIKNNIEEFLDNYLSNQNMLDDENINFQEEIKASEKPTLTNTYHERLQKALEKRHENIQKLASQIA
jgi:hypothetical protein